MRSTFEIDDDVMLAARDIARLQNKSIGRAISELARRGLAAEPAVVIREDRGIPVIVHEAAVEPVTNATVRRLLEEE